MAMQSCRFGVFDWPALLMFSEFVFSIIEPSSAPDANVYLAYWRRQNYRCKKNAYVVPSTTVRCAFYSRSDSYRKPIKTSHSDDVS